MNAFGAWPATIITMKPGHAIATPSRWRTPVLTARQSMSRHDRLGVIARRALGEDLEAHQFCIGLLPT
jgi:hypothetical protein